MTRSNLLLSFGALFLYFFSAEVQGFEINLEDTGLVFFSFLAIYTFHGRFNAEMNNPVDREEVPYYKSLLSFWVGLLALGLAVLCFVIHHGALIFVFPFFILGGLAYGFPLHKIKGFARFKIKRFRDLPYLKSPLLSLAISLFIFFAPRESFELSEDSWLCLSYLFIHVFINAWIGDLRDIKRDSELSTLAGWLGFEKSRGLMVGLICAYLLFCFSRPSLVFSFSIGITSMYTIFFLWSLRPKQPTNIYHFADLAHFTPYLLLLLAKNIF